jgi:hypothetical protein
MLRKISILFIFFLMLGVGFFAVMVNQQLSKESPQGTATVSEAESYCLFKKGFIIRDTTGVYCGYGENRELVDDFFNRVGEW